MAISSLSLDKYMGSDKMSPQTWAALVGVGSLLVGGLVGYKIADESGEVVRFNAGDCTEHAMAPGERADNIAQELGANEGGEVSSAIHGTLDEQGYGTFRVCHDGDNWSVEDVDNE